MYILLHVLGVLGHHKIRFGLADSKKKKKKKKKCYTHSSPLIVKGGIKPTFFPYGISRKVGQFFSRSFTFGQREDVFSCLTGRKNDIAALAHAIAAAAAAAPSTLEEKDKKSIGAFFPCECVRVV